MKHLTNILLNSAQSWPEHIAIYDHLGTLTFRQLNLEVEQLLQSLMQFGITPNQTIGLRAKNGRDFIISLFAVLQTGALVVPLSNDLSFSELEPIFKDLSLNFLVDDGSGCDLPIAMKKLNHKLQISKISNATLVQNVKDPAFIRFTSGTTGKSKGVLLSDKSVFERIQATQKVLNLTPQDTVLWTLPMAYHFIASVVAYIYSGTAIAIPSDSSPKSLLELAKKVKPTILYAAPQDFWQLVEYDPTKLKRDELKSLRLALSTSGATASHISQKFKEKYSVSVSQGYGVIEVGLPIINFEASNLKSVGACLAPYQAVILDQNLEPLPNGKIGQLALKGPGMFDAYVSPYRSNTDVLHQGWFLTGDYALINPDNQIEVLGRIKSAIEIDKKLIFPEQIEAEITAFSAIKMARVFWESKLLSAQIILDSKLEFDLENFKEFLAEKLEAYQIPQNFEFVEEIKLTATGKIVR